MLEIRFDDLVIEKNGEKSDRLNALFFPNFNFLENEDRRYLDPLLLRFDEIKEGTFKIDGEPLGQEGIDIGRLFLIAITVKGTARFSALFLVPKKIEKIKDLKMSTISEITSLRDKPSETEEDKKAKIASLAAILKARNCVYAIVDLDEKINSENRGLILNSLKEHDLLVIIFPQKEKKEAPKKERRNPLKEIKVETFGSKLFVPFLKKELTTFLFFAVFSIISTFGSCIASCFFKEGRPAYGVVSLLIALVCFFVNIDAIGAVYEDLSKYSRGEVDLLKTKIIVFFSTAVGVALGSLLSYIIIKKEIVVVSKVDILVLLFPLIISILVMISSFFLDKIFYLSQRLRKVGQKILKKIAKK